MLARIDLHTHSTASDGTLTPAEVVDAAVLAGLDVVALTDHESATGWEAARARARETGIGFLPGIELSTKLRGASIHVLGYLVDPTTAELAEEMRRVRDARLVRATQMIDALSADYPLSREDVDAQISDGATVGRPHIADALVAKGIVPDRSAAFAALLHPRSPYYVSTYAPPPDQAIRLIRAAGGVPVLAHPGRAYLSGRLTDAVIADLVDAGLAGVEVWHRENEQPTRAHLLELAKRHGLITTGSSDFHGAGKPNRIGENLTPQAALQQIVGDGTGAAALI